jgi:hypothetical protein
LIEVHLASAAAGGAGFGVGAGFRTRTRAGVTEDIFFKRDRSLCTKRRFFKTDFQIVAKVDARSWASLPSTTKDVVKEVIENIGETAAAEAFRESALPANAGVARSDRRRRVSGRRLSLVGFR